MPFGQIESHSELRKVWHGLTLAAATRADVIDMNANYNKQTDARLFERLAPALALEPAVIESWGVLNVAQVAQQNGETDGCWSLDYLTEAFCGTIGGLDPEMHAELKAIWDAAC